MLSDKTSVGKVASGGLRLRTEVTVGGGGGIGAAWEVVTHHAGLRALYKLGVLQEIVWKVRLRQVTKSMLWQLRERGGSRLSLKRQTSSLPKVVLRNR